jgi:rare lipoprotein A
VTRCVRVLLPVALLAAAGCSSVDPEPAKSAEVVVAPQQNDVVNPPRSARGNPAEYEVMGRRYRVMNSSDGYRDTGVASWYGRDFHGRSTSSGERYDMFGMTAAHKTLPLPTWVEVTNQRNGKSVIVKVNDRGPFVDDRIIDLSYAAALELDMVRSGTAPVFVRALGAPATLPQVAGSGAAEPTPEERVVFAQVGAFSDESNAQRMVSQLHNSGFDNAEIHSAQGGGVGIIHRVRIGPLGSDSMFTTVRDQLLGLGFDGAQMIVEFVRN